MKIKHTLITPLIVGALTNSVFAEPTNDTYPNEADKVNGRWAVKVEALYMEAVSGFAYYEQEHQFNYRLSFEKRIKDNVGLRFRYMNFDSQKEVGPPHVRDANQLGPDIISYNLELYTNFSLGHSEFQMGAGIQHTELLEEYGVVPPADIDVDYEAYGLSIFFSSSIPLSERWAGYVNFRYTSLMGTYKEIQSSRPREHSHSNAYTELGAGIKYMHKKFELSLGYEFVQMTQGAEFVGEDLNLRGLVLGAVYKF